MSTPDRHGIQEAGGLIMGRVDLSKNMDDIPNDLRMSLGVAVLAGESGGSYGAIILDHLAADGAGFAGSQVTVVAVGQVDAHLGSCLHLELVHGLTSLGDIQLVVVLVAHNRSLLFVYPESKMLSGWRASFSFRSHSFTIVGICMNVKWRKEWIEIASDCYEYG